MDEWLESWPDPLSLCGKASKRHLPRTTDVESLASHYTNVVTRFKTLVSMYPR